MRLKVLGPQKQRVVARCLKLPTRDSLDGCAIRFERTNQISTENSTIKVVLQSFLGHKTTDAFPVDAGREGHAVSLKVPCTLSLKRNIHGHSIVRQESCHEHP